MAGISIIGVNHPESDVPVGGNAVSDIPTSDHPAADHSIADDPVPDDRAVDDRAGDERAGNDLTGNERAGVDPGGDGPGVDDRAGDDSPHPGPTEWGEHPHGVGPWDREHGTSVPEDPRLDPELITHGDRRNVVDAYRYWTREAIVADIDRRRHPFHVAIENFGHDANIGTVVRTANAFAAAAVHIVGRRRWNRRGAMVTDRYQHIEHHADIGELLEYAARHDLTVVAVDNVPGSVPLETARLPLRCLLLFGQEGPGVTDDAKQAAAMTVSIAQFGSTRSINAGVAAGIAMHAWVRQYADLTTSW